MSTGTTKPDCRRSGGLAGPRIRVVQSTWNKFHHFALARELHARGHLEAIYSTYPWWKLKNEGLPREKVHCRSWLNVPVLALMRYNALPAAAQKAWHRLLVADYTSWLENRIPACDVFVALSGSGLEAGRRTQQRGGYYICDRGSPHIRYMDELLHEEYARWNLPFEGTHLHFIAHEEREYEQADTITVPSQFARRSFLQMGLPEEKLRCVPYGVDLAQFSPVGRPPMDEFRVLFVGRVSILKGIPYLLHAFARLRHPRKRLILIGGVEPEMERIIGGRRIQGLEVMGRVPHAELSRYMSTSHVQVLPSLVEGLALVQGEAMACGCPLISSEHAGGEDLFTHGREGFVVPVRDVDALAVRLEQLAQDSALRERMSAAALERVTQLGGWKNYGDAMERVILELVGRKGRRPADPLAQTG